jgi:hypothetical protein
MVINSSMKKRYKEILLSAVAFAIFGELIRWLAGSQVSLSSVANSLVAGFLTAFTLSFFIRSSGSNDSKDSKE